MVDVLNTEIQVNLFQVEKSRHFSIDLIVTLFPGHSSETMFHLWLLFYPEIQFRSG
jgi:hypothetical protein